MLDIEHLFDSVLSCLERDGDLRELEKHPATQEMLANVSATFEEIEILASYVYSCCTSGTLCPECTREAAEIYYENRINAMEVMPLHEQNHKSRGG